MAEMDEARLCAVVDGMAKDARDYANERSVDRQKMLAFYDGDADDLQQYIPADDGRSRVVSRDVRAAVRKVLPSVLRTILGNDEVVEYTPMGEGDDDAAAQAGDYVNYVVLPECNGRQSIEDSISDALRLRNGVLKWWCDYRTETRTSSHIGLDDAAFAQLVADDDVEVLEHTARQDTIEVPGIGAMPVTFHDLKIRRTINKKLPCLKVVEPEKLLINSDATSFADAALLGEHDRLRRSDLVAMGYDRDVIWALPTAGAGDTEQEGEEQARRRDVVDNDDADEATKAMQEVDYYDLLVRVDYDGDGIAELRRMVFAGGFNETNLLENVEWDEINYGNVISERRAHQWEGNSIADEVMDIETIKTVLLRQTMDNLYWQNNPQPIGQRGAIDNPDALMNPEFGKPIWGAEGVDIRAAVGFLNVPFVAKESFSMLEYMDGEATDRTGISEASSGMAPDALQNMTAKASAMIESAGIGQTEMMVRCIAESLKPAFKGLLKLVIENQDQPRTVRLRDEWVQVDPRSWNADMDAVVNIGLGAGTRERDMMMMQQVVAMQDQVLASLPPEIAMMYVTPENAYNSRAKLIEAAGLKSVGLYFTQPDPEAIKQALAARSQQPSPEQVKAQTTLAVEDKRTQREVIKTQAQTQAKVAEARLKAQVDANREREQRDADLVVRLQEIEAEAAARMQDAVAESERNRDDNATELTKAGMQQDTKREEMAVDYRMHREDLAAQAQRDERNNQANIQREQARSVGKAFEKNERADGSRTGRNGR